MLMATISVPLSAELEERLDSLVASGTGANRADVMRKALERLAEEEAIREVIEAQQEPTLRGDVRELFKKFE